MKFNAICKTSVSGSRCKNKSCNFCLYSKIKLSKRTCSLKVHSVSGDVVFYLCHDMAIKSWKITCQFIYLNFPSSGIFKKKLKKYVVGFSEIRKGTVPRKS